MTESELQDFEAEIEALAAHPYIKPHRRRDVVQLARLTRSEIAALMAGRGAGYYFLLAATGLSRTSLRAATRVAEATVLAPRERQAFAVQERLPPKASFRETAAKAVTIRKGDIRRKRSGGIETLFRERLEAERVPLLMHPIRRVPGILIGLRKPDGVYPDPAMGLAPRLYLEIKNIRRVSDDIQKRLYELAEASLEMKLLYGDLRLHGFQIHEPSRVTSEPRYRAALREQITASVPVVVGLFLCSRTEAERYRAGAEAFVDRVFFQEEIDQCITFLKDSIRNIDRS